ncbi:hypothetical protein HHI36_006487 [Cryptolaemus montrouzieri]|uniref:DNA topoisomerase I n=2 Tax=Cryptolaemus montrouzieri TaxID=559131 RepID=A0ABD2NXA1_9CUCU
MEIENSSNGDISKSDKNTDNSENNHINGINGYSSTENDKHRSERSEHKSKHKDKDRDKDRDKYKSKDHKSSSKDKDRHSSSKDKDRHSSHKSSSKDKDRDREKDRGDRDKDKDRHRDKDKHRDDKKHSSSSSSRDKDKDRKNRDKDRDHKSSHDKDHKSSSRDKDKDHRDKEHRDKEKDKDRSKHSSSRDKDKEREKDRDKSKHSSSSKDKDKYREKDKNKHSSSKEKEKKEKIDEPKIPEPKVEPDSAAEDSVNNESMDEDDNKLSIKEEPDSQDEKDITANLSQASSCDYNLSQFSKSEPAFEDGEEEEEEEREEEKPVVKEEPEEDSDEDIPLRSSFHNKARLATRMSTAKRKMGDSDEDDEDDVPLSARKKPKKEKKKIMSDDEDDDSFSPVKKKEKKKKQTFIDDDDEDEEDCKPVKKEKKKKKIESEDEDDYEKPKAKKQKKPPKPVKKEQTKTKVKTEPQDDGSPKKGRKKKEEEEQEVWKWWEEEKKEDGTKWNFLEHKGPVFAPEYEPLPSNIKFFYDGEEIKLSQDAEEIAGFYAKMLDHDYTSKEAFNTNFFKDWRKSMTEKEKSKITDLKKCNFKQMHAFFMDLAEKNRNRTKEEKLALKEKNEAMIKEYGFCTIDGHKEKIGNFKIEPPGLFRGRGEHPKMGKLKRRVIAEDIIINCSKDSEHPKPPEGHKWKEVRHDNTVTWLASWTENVQNQVKYIMLNPSSKLKGEKDMMKYETARRLHSCIDKIRKEYREDWKSKEMRVRQRAVALYFIDKLALRAGNEKDEDQADTVGCCSLRFEHIELHEKKDDKEYVVVFDFLGKDSIRYYNEVPVEKRVFKNLQLFMENKQNGDDLFDRLNTSIMNKHLNELMEGLTAKVFRTYNASWTLQQQLDLLTNEDDTVAEKILSYNRANRAVAILCNHQRSVPKGHQKSMEKLKEKIEDKKNSIKDAERQVKDAKRDANNGSVKEKMVYDKKKKMLERLKDQLSKLEIQETDRDENKTIALGTSKLNYLDPRISVAWCKKYNVPIEKIYNKTQRDKFRWAIDMAGPDYRF